MEAPPPPRPRRRIKPAGWVVIVLALGSVLWFGGRALWPHVAPLLERSAPSPVTEPVEPSAPTPPDVLSRELFPASAASLPQVRGHVARLALPPLAGVPRTSTGLVHAQGELEALSLVAAGQADMAIASVPALAASPQAVRAGVRAVWSLGPSPADALVFPSCDRTALESARLGVEQGTAGHLFLLAAFVGGPAPQITLYDGFDALRRALADGVVSGGATRALEQERARDVKRCPSLPEAATTLVVVRREELAPSAAEVASVVALARQPSSPEEVAAFFDPHRTAPGGFYDLFAAAGEVWKSVGIIEAAIPPEEAVDRRLLEGEGGAFPAQGRVRGAAPASSRFGRASWPDRH